LSPCEAAGALFWVLMPNIFELLFNLDTLKDLESANYKLDAIKFQKMLLFMDLTRVYALPVMHENVKFL
jgi:hypothetical protein